MEKNNLKLITGILVGAAAGVGLGLLLSPDKGKNIRKKVLNKVDEISKKTKNTFDEFLRQSYIKTKENNP